MPEYDLDQWRTIASGEVPQPSRDYIVIAFPNEEVAQAYLSRASTWPEEEVRSILRTMLGASRSEPFHDRLNVEFARQRLLNPSTNHDGLLRPQIFSEYIRRAILSVTGRSHQPTIEGLTWVLDLLPHAPKPALDAIRAYTVAHFDALSDWRISGLADASAIIRSRYILQDRHDLSARIDLLLSLDWRDFEYLVAGLYAAQNYQVEVTPAQKDRGKDIIATGSRGELVYIECKNWKGKVDAAVVASLAGRVETERATRGVLVATSGFTSGPASATEFAQQAATRISLVGGHELVQDINTHLGADWPVRIDRLIQTQKRRQRSTPLPH